MDDLDGIMWSNSSTPAEHVGGFAGNFIMLTKCRMILAEASNQAAKAK